MLAIFTVSIKESLQPTVYVDFDKRSFGLTGTRIQCRPYVFDTVGKGTGETARLIHEH